MLVLTRKLQQQIKIGDGIVITILQIRGQAVRVGIEAPRSTRVLRAELPENEPALPSVTTVELQPNAAPATKAQPLPNQPLADRLRARRAPSASFTAVTCAAERLGPATLAIVG